MCFVWLRDNTTMRKLVAYEGVPREQVISITYDQNAFFPCLHGLNILPNSIYRPVLSNAIKNGLKMYRCEKLFCRPFYTRLCILKNMRRSLKDHSLQWRGSKNWFFFFHFHDYLLLQEVSLQLESWYSRGSGILENENLNFEWKELRNSLLEVWILRLFRKSEISFRK